MTTRDERIAKLEVTMEEGCKNIDELTDNYSSFKKEIFEKLDDIGDRLTKIETKLETRDEEGKTVLNIRFWLIGLSIATAINVIGFFLRR